MAMGTSFARECVELEGRFHSYMACALERIQVAQNPCGIIDFSAKKPLWAGAYGIRQSFEVM